MVVSLGSHRPGQGRAGATGANRVEAGVGTAEEAVVRRMCELWATRDTDALVDLLAEDGVSITTFLTGRWRDARRCLPGYVGSSNG